MLNLTNIPEENLPLLNLETEGGLPVTILKTNRLIRPELHMYMDYGNRLVAATDTIKNGVVKLLQVSNGKCQV